MLAAFNLSPPCRYLWPIVVAAFVLYPYTKRFTWLCHYALGLTDGLAPAAAWIAVSGSLALAPVLLFFAVGLWVGGFDAIYGCFDVDFDRREGIHSIAARFGEAAALRAAAASHAAAIALLVWAGVSWRLPVAYYAGMVLVGALLMWSSVDIARRGLSRVGMGFMTVERPRGDRVPRGRHGGGPGVLAESPAPMLGQRALGKSPISCRRGRCRRAGRGSTRLRIHPRTPSGRRVIT